MLVAARGCSLGREVLVGLNLLAQIVGLDLTGIGADTLRTLRRRLEGVGDFVAHASDGRAECPVARRGCGYLAAIAKPTFASA